MYVMGYESGLTQFPFSYLDHMTLLTLAQVRLSPCSEFAHWLSFSLPNYHFRQAAPQHAELLQL